MKTRHIVCEWVGEKGWEAPIITVSGGRTPATPKLLGEDWSARAGLATLDLASKGCPARGYARLTAALARGAWRLRLSAAILTLALVGSASGQLFDNLQQFSQRLKVGDPSIDATKSKDGPKDIATADFNDDGRPDIAVSNTDGSVTVFYGEAGGKFSAPVHLHTGGDELRGIVCADFTGDGKPDIAVAAPYTGEVFVFVNQSGSFGTPEVLAMWPGARNLAAGDFDGDGVQDLVVAGTTIGLRQLRGIGNANFEEVTNLTDLSSADWDFPKPVYSMSVFRPEGASRDELVATHANTDLVWVLAAGTNGMLEVTGIVTNQNAHSVVTGPIAGPSTNGIPDFISASRDRGTIEVHRGSTNANRFEQEIYQKIQVPGGPRALQIVDLDHDGWNDLAVVLRNFDRVLTYHNSNGVLVASTEMTVGTSPREIVAGNFNGDAYPDVAVMNHDSEDVSVLFTYPGQTGFAALDTVYPVDGEVSALVVRDVNGDGRADVLQLHRASAELSIRLTGPNGRLGDPTFVSVGSRPCALSMVDVNNDSILDAVVVNLGIGGIEPGSVSVRLGTGTGEFGPERRFSLPEGVSGGLFALVPGDFDGDGDIDLAAGFFDCRIAFFENVGNGVFEYRKHHMFVYEARVMVVGDFDQDGDLDIAGAGFAGDVVVIENKGDLLTTDNLTRYDYKSPTSKKFGTRDIVATDLNHDGDLDLVVGSGDGTMIFFGAAGMAFERGDSNVPGTRFPNGAVALGDFDGDGKKDLAVACKILSCISILTGSVDGAFTPTVSVDVPAGEFLATGDLDGDGLADLVGSGTVLWTALSSHRPQTTAARVVQANRTAIASPVINEFLAINNKVPLDIDGNRNSDWVEIYNGGQVALPLNGWKLRLAYKVSETAWATNIFSFPATAFLGIDAHLVVICSETRRTPYHTGFRLPGDGGILTLLNPSGQEVNKVAYPAQQENISYARYRDGLPSFVFNPYPSPGRANTDNGPVEPIVQLESLQPDALQPGQPIRFHVNGRDDVGIVSVTVVYQRLDIPSGEVNRILLYDDGMNGDGEMSDGHFSGLLEPGLPDGGEIQFYLEVTDLSGQTVVFPSEPVFSRGPGAPILFSLAVNPPRPAIEISEILADNATGLRDETGGTPDWVEIRNCSPTPIPLQNVGLSTSLFAIGSRFNFGGPDVLAPGEHRVIYCDDSAGPGPSHAPFRLNRAGDHVYLTGLTANGARMIVDSISFGPQGTDVSIARLGCGGPLRPSAPTPRQGNIAGEWIAFASSNGGTFTLAFNTQTNSTYVVEQTGSVTSSAWAASAPIAGDGIEKVITQPINGQRFLRVKKL